MLKIKKILCVILIITTNLLCFQYIFDPHFKNSISLIGNQNENSDHFPEFQNDNSDNDFLSESINFNLLNISSTKKNEILFVSLIYLNPVFTIWQPPKIII